MKEDLICTRFVNYLKSLISVKQQKVDNLIYFHIPNGGSRKSSIEGYKFKLMGVLPGVPDYQFIWKKNGETKFGFIEFKTEKGRQSESQKQFEADCLDVGAPYAIARSSDQGIQILKDWGVLK